MLFFLSIFLASFCWTNISICEALNCSSGISLSIPGVNVTEPFTSGFNSTTCLQNNRTNQVSCYELVIPFTVSHEPGNYTFRKCFENSSFCSQPINCETNVEFLNIFLSVNNVSVDSMGNCAQSCCRNDNCNSGKSSAPNLSTSLHMNSLSAFIIVAILFYSVLLV